MKTLLLIIDMQNDFCMPDGTLYIPGAEKDVKQLAGFIAKESSNIDQIILTQDNHHVLDIAHPGFWRNANHEMPAPFSTISYEDVESGKWRPITKPKQVSDYMQKLTEQGEYPHTIWPEHCLIGSTGAAIVPELMQQIVSWARQGRYYEVVRKGIHPLTEHFGALRANIPDAEVPETQLNTGLVEILKETDKIIIAGEAKSHCVANTIKQLFDFPELIKKLVILYDCMTDVPGTGHLGAPIYEKALQLGVQSATTDKLTL